VTCLQLLSGPCDDLCMPKAKKAKRGSTRGPRKILAVTYDITGLAEDQIGALESEATVQGEASDGQGGKRYNGKTGHPDVPVLGAKVVAGTKKSAGRTWRETKLVVEYDVSGLTKTEIGYLASEAEVQAEESDEHPSVAVTSKVVGGD